MTMVKVKVNNQRLEDLLCCALEGGSNYWYTITHYNYPPGETSETSSLEYPHLELPFKGGSVIIEDQFDDFPEKELDMDAIEQGIQLLERLYPGLFADFIKENEDATTGDIFLQLCLYGEVIYG